MATGTFDILHPGHLLYLERSKALGDELVVIVARDSNVKHKPRPVIPEEQRLQMVSSLKVVDMAVLGSEFDIFEPIRAIRPDIITLGFDQFMDKTRLEVELAKRGIKAEVVRITEKDRCPLCSSRRIVSKITEERGDIDLSR